MKFEFVKIVLPLELADYIAAYAGQRLQVWVNPPRAMKQEREEIIRRSSRMLKGIIDGQQSSVINSQSSEKPFLKRVLGIFKRQMDSTELIAVQRMNTDMFGWLSRIWSQHEDMESRWTVDEIQVVYDTDPALYQWMVRRTIEMMESFRTEKKKA
jgi:hypothetical protein